MKRGNVAECYLDNLAVRLESIRMGKGQGWRRFLVFAALTKSKKGAEYIALFTYFSFQSECPGSEILSWEVAVANPSKPGSACSCAPVPDRSSTP